MDSQCVFCVRSCKAQKLADEDLFAALGCPGEGYWATMRDNYGSKEHGRDCLALMLYGDEADALGTSFMVLNWSSEHSIWPENPSASRFVITLFEKERYAMSPSGKNLTLQAVLEKVVASFNVWSKQPVQGCYGAVTTLKGDRKFITQALSLRRHYNSNAICFRCLATKDTTCPYTDISESAAWRATFDAELPWDPEEPPAVKDLYNFSLAAVGIDVLHTWHLGLARDVIASVLVILLRQKDFFASTNMKNRLLEASRLAKEYARNVAGRAFPRRWLFTRARLHLHSQKYAEFHGKGWQAAVLLKWIEQLFRERGAPSDDLFAAVALGNNFIPMMTLAREQGSFFTVEQATQIQTLGQAWLEVYLRLHVQHKLLGGCVFRLFNPRPKLHMFQHLLLGCHGLKNPAAAMTWMDEDWLKRILRLTKAVHKRTAAVNTLLRWCAGIKPHLEAALERTDAQQVQH